MKECTLRIKSCIVQYRTHRALGIPELVTSGATIAVIGHNGSGKSTLLKSITGLLTLHEGVIAVEADGRVLAPQREMAFCPENGAIFADVTVQEYLMLWCRLRHRDASYYRKDGADIIERMAVEPLFKKLGRELSKGQKRRVQIAASFLIRPRLLLLDEPFDGLDVQQTEHLVEVMRDYSTQTSYILSSHRMEIVERVADRVIVLRGGSLVTSGSVAEVCRSIYPAQDSASLREAMSRHVQGLDQAIE